MNIRQEISRRAFVASGALGILGAACPPAFGFTGGIDGALRLSIRRVAVFAPDEVSVPRLNISGLAALPLGLARFSLSMQWLSGDKASPPFHLWSFGRGASGYQSAPMSLALIPGRGVRFRVTALWAGDEAPVTASIDLDSGLGGYVLRAHRGTFGRGCDLGFSLRAAKA